MNLVLWLIVKLLHRPVVCANFQGLDANTFPQLAESVKAIVELNFNVRKRLSETTLAAADRAKAASPTPDITLLTTACEQDDVDTKYLVQKSPEYSSTFAKVQLYLSVHNVEYQVILRRYSGEYY